MCFALISFLLATPQRAQAQTREAYVAQSADETTLTFYYDALRATRTGTTWGIEETKKEGDDTFPAWAGTRDVGDSTTARVVFDASFRDFRPTTTAAWFYHCKALTKIEGLEYLNTSEVKDMSSMFWGCSALTSLDLKNFNTQNVTDMSVMFNGCSGLTSLDVSHFNTQNVTDMSVMFSDCSGLPSLDLSHFNTQNVTDMRYMFLGCSGLPSLDVSHFNTQNVTSMFGMFDGCSGLSSLDLSHFNTQNVTDMGHMFSDCSGLTSIDLSHFNTQNVTDMGGMFSGCSGLPSLDLSHFNTQNVTGMSVMFSGCSGLTSLDVSHFNTQNVTSMRRMFSDCSGLTSLDVSHFNTQNVTDMGGMFDYCSGLTSLDLSHFNTQNVTDMGGMFSGCSGLTSLDLSHFNTQNVTDMIEMFKGCSALMTINSNTAWQCPESYSMFADCWQLTGAGTYDEKEEEMPAYRRTKKKFNAIVQALINYQGEDSGIADKVFDELMVQERLWNTDNDVMVKRRNYLGLPAIKYPAFDRVITQFTTKARLFRQNNEIKEAEETKRIQRKLDSFLTNNRSLIGATTTLKLDRSKVNYYINLNNLDRLQKNIQVMNLFDFVTEFLDAGDLIILHGADQLDIRTSDYLRDQFERTFDKKVRILLSYDVTDSLEPPKRNELGTSSVFTMNGRLFDFNLGVDFSFIGRMDNPRNYEEMVNAELSERTKVDIGYSGSLGRSMFYRSATKTLHLMGLKPVC